MESEENFHGFLSLSTMPPATTHPTCADTGAMLGLAQAEPESLTLTRPGSGVRVAGLTLHYVHVRRIHTRPEKSDDMNFMNLEREGKEKQKIGPPQRGWPQFLLPFGNLKMPGPR